MGETIEEAAMARSGRPKLVILPRDPDVAYVFWEWPGAGDEKGSGELTVLVDGPGNSRRVVESFLVREERGGRFIRFQAGGAHHQGKLQWGDVVVNSEVVTAPRRESGEKSPAFVRVRLTDRGLAIDPAKHDHHTHGIFPAAAIKAPSSHSFD